MSVSVFADEQGQGNHSTATDATDAQATDGDKVISEQQPPIAVDLIKKIRTIRQQAVFDVYQNSIFLGSSTHWYQCYKVKCEIKSLAKPEGFASLLTNETITENSVLRITQQGNLRWEQYLYRKKDKKKLVDEQHYRDIENTIVELKTKKTTKLVSNTYDILSLAYILQWHRYQLGKISERYALIEDSFYYKSIHFKKVGDSYIDTAGKKVKTEYYKYKHPRVVIEVWLAPLWSYFPAKIVVLNRQKNNRAIFNLRKPPSTTLVKR